MKKLLLVLLFTSLFIPLSVQAEMSCSVKASCSSGETDIFHMSNLSNAHAEMGNQTAYGYKVCCGGVKGGLTNQCGTDSEAVILKLSGLSNAHAEKGTLSNYQYQVCLGANEGIINCDYVSSPSLCTALSPYYKCLATISNDTNAHVSDCDGTNDYNIKLCCGYSDITPPVTGIAPAGSSWIGQDIPFTLTCTDTGGYCQATSGGATYYKIINDGQPCGSTGFSAGTSGAVTCSPGSACTSRVCYYSRDDSANMESVKTSDIFRVDKKPPTTTDNSDDYWHGNDVKITLSCQDAESGCRETSYCIYDEGGAQCNPSIQGNAVNLPCQQSVCRKIIRYYSTDNSNNQEPARNSKTIKIDITLPTCTIASLSEYTNSNTVNISWFSSSQGSPVSNVTLEKNETGAWETMQTFMTASGSYEFTGQNNRTYHFRCLATNTQGNSSYSGEVKTTVDTGMPSGSITAAGIVNTTTFDVSWSGTDAETGVSNYTVYYKTGSGPYSAWDLGPADTSAKFGDNGIPLLPQNNNTYMFKVRVMDMAGNAKESNETHVLVDTAKPNCTIQSVPAYQASSDFTVTWSGEDGESGIKEYIVEQRTASSWIQFYRGSGTSKDIINANDGTYRFRCRTIDNANNMGGLSSEKSTTVDINPPAADINFSSSVYVNDNLNINAKVTDAIRVSNVTLYYNNAVVPGTATQNPNYSVWDIAWTISDLVTTGTKTFTISVQDMNGNSQNYTKQFLVAYCTPGEVIQGCICGTGTKTCLNNGNWSECTGVTKQPTPEVCNGEDDDCNLITDDKNGGNSILSTQCQCFGSSLLSAQQSETCDGIDNDCDGQIDEGGGCCTDEDTQPCGIDVGICKNKRKTCSNQIWGSCEWEEGPNPGGEICGNSLDDDCNGDVDDSCTVCIDTDGDGYGDPASNQCTYSEQDCDDSDPNANPGTPEVCDVTDNNCDGQIDEGLSCDACSNGIQDGNEEGTDCGGDCPPCFVWGWLFLTAGGVVILIILAFVWLHMKKQGRELTWEELKKKWTPSEFIIKKHK